MIHEYGPPATTAVGHQGKAPTDAGIFSGKRGIIAFQVAGWSNATGHLDLWDGSKCIHEAYFRQGE